MLLKNRESDVLIIVFSSCTKVGVTAKYHYINTLKNISANKLYILDDKASDKRGGYYIGSNNEFEDEIIVKKLIDKCILETDAKKIIYVGSSKGAYAALNFGLDRPNSIMIVGAPQYRLGTYLNNIEGDKATLKYIIGNQIKRQYIESLDYRLEMKIKNNIYNMTQKIYMHYSINEENYVEHIAPLINDLLSTKIFLKCDISEYDAHAEVGKYYPKFLIKVLNEVIDNEIK